jgi:hypothetical protein
MAYLHSLDLVHWTVRPDEFQLYIDRILSRRQGWNDLEMRLKIESESMEWDTNIIFDEATIKYIKAFLCQTLCHFGLSITFGDLDSFFAAARAETKSYVKAGESVPV